MKKFRKLFAFLLAAPLFLGSCIMNNGICYTHTDANKDGICDVCGSKVKVEPSEDANSGVIPGNPCVTHVDHDLDGTCDVCGANMAAPAHDHIDGDQDGKCDICGASMIICNHHNDANGDGKCDNCGADMPIVTGDVTVYLVLSSVGLYNGQKGDTFIEMNLENTIAYIGQVGSLLPGKDVVTHSYGSATFDSWVAYDGAGAPTVYTKVPAIRNKILYAQFVPNGQTPVPPTDTPDPVIPDEDTIMKTYTLKTSFTGGNWSVSNPDILVWCWSNSSSKMYTATKVDDDTYTFSIKSYADAKYYDSLLFLRLPTGNGASFDPQRWGEMTIWNQSTDLAIDFSKSVAKITGWGDGEGAKCPVVWES